MVPKNFGEIRNEFEVPRVSLRLQIVQSIAETVSTHLTYSLAHSLYWYYCHSLEMIFIFLYLILLPFNCVSLWTIPRLSLYSSSYGPVVDTDVRNKLIDMGSKSKHCNTRFQCASKDVGFDTTNKRKKDGAKGRQGSSSRGNAITKIKADIEEVKQAINNVQVVIVSVGQEIKEVAAKIEATEKELLSGKLSPSNMSILTKKFDSLLIDKKALMDEKKALMDEKKALMDKEKALMDKEKALEDKKASIISTTQEIILNPFVYSMENTMNFPESDGGKVIFKREWLIKGIADMALIKHKDGKYNSYYWRAPMGSGKSVFLYLMGKELQDRGCDVYFIVSPKMETFKGEYFRQLAENAGDKIVVLLIDEVQNNIFSVHWNDLLKGRRPSNLLVLGVGIPRLAPASPHFGQKFPKEAELFPMFLTAKDIPEVVALFCKESSQPEEVVTKLCEQVLAFTNGHLFPFVTIIEHMLDAKIKVNLSDISPYLSSEEFRKSGAYESIKSRCSFLSENLESATNILKNVGTEGDFANSEKLGIIHNGAFISPFVMNEVFLKMQCDNEVEAIKLDESKGIESCTTQLICAGLRYIRDNDFSDIKIGKVAVENAISMKWGSNVKHALPNVMMYFQARTVYEYHGGPGAKPLIDFVFNGRLNLGVEVAVNLNANGIKEHVQRFDDKYKLLKENGVVLHIDTKRSQPVLVQSLDNDPNDRIYTFLTSRNELYRGSELVATQVSKHLASPFELPTSKNASKYNSE